MSLTEKFLGMARSALAGRVPAAASAPAPVVAAVATSTPAPVVTSRPADPPAPRVLATFATHDQVLGDRVLSRGAARLWELLHRLALDVAREREYLQQVRQVVYHCPAVTLCGVLGVTDRHLRRLALELEAAGLLDSGAHAQMVGCRSMYDGTLWGVLVAPGGEPPRLRAEDWKHQWRPDFAADVVGKTGAFAEMSGLLTEGADEGEKYRAAKQRAAIPAGQNPPPLSSSDILPRPSLGAVVLALGELWHLHATKRARAVGVIASQICSALGESDRRRYWCRVIWDALQGENCGRGSLQVLQAQVSRLEADLREGAPWRNPGAVLAARLKAA